MIKSRWVHSFIHYWYKDLKKFFQENGKAFWQEMINTQEMVIILAKMAVFKPITANEKKAVIQQFKDLGKMGIVFSIFLMPGGSVLLPLLARFLPWNFLPSSFKRTVKKEVKVTDDFFVLTDMDKIKELEQELQLELGARKVYYLIDDFMKAVKERKTLGNEKALREHYIEPNHHHFLLLIKHFHMELSTLKNAIRRFNWDKSDQVLKEIEKSLFRKSLENKTIEVVDSFEKLLNHPIPFKIILMISFSIFEKTFLYDDNKFLFYFSLEELLYRQDHPKKTFRLILTKQIALLLRPALIIRNSYENIIPGNILNVIYKLPFRERFYHIGVSLIIAEKLCSDLKEYELMDIDKNEFNKLKKYYREDIPQILGKKDSDPINNMDKYVSFLLCKKLIKQYTYFEILHLSTDFYFKQLNDL